MIADLRFALRQLRRSPGFTAAAVITLALGIGACAAAYGLARGLLWRPLQFSDPERVVVLHVRNPSRGIDEQGLSYLDLRDLRAQTTSVTGLAGISQRQAAVGSPEGAERATGWIADPSLFDVVGIPAAIGRTLRAGDADPAAPPVVVLSYGYWTRRFGRDPRAVGSTLTINGAARTIVGVMPDSFRVVRGNLWMPVVPDPTESRDDRSYDVIGRLRPGVSFSAARAELAAAVARLAVTYPATDRGWELKFETYRDAVVDPGTRRALGFMLAAVGLVLLIACADVAGLLLARGAGRARELAVRAAVGASRGRLVRQALIECVVLAAFGGALGVVLASWGNDLLLATLPMEDVPVWLDVSVDGVSLAVTAAVTIGAVFLFGLLPALRASRPDVVDVLKGAGGSAAGTRARSALVVTQVGLAVVLLAASALFGQSFLARQTGNLGFDDRPVLSERVFFGALFRGDRIAWMRDALARVRAMPGVAGAALTGTIPGDDGGDHRELAAEGRPVVPGEEPMVTLVPESDDLPGALGITPLSGRWFTAAESRDRNAAVAAVGAGLARRFWPDGDAVGHRVRALPDTTWLTIVGVVGDLQWEEFGEDGDADRLQLHVPYGREPWRSVALMVRGSVPPVTLAEPVRRTVAAVSADVPVFDVRTMSEVRRETGAGDRVWVLMFGALGAQALLMTAVGLYGLLAFGVSQRQREIGVRVALGARPASVVRLVVGRALALTGAGLAVGLAGAALTSRAVGSILYGVHGTLTPLVVVFATLLVTALLAALLPAARAARVDPIVALRAE